MAGSSDLVNNVIFLTITGRAAGKEIHMPYTEKKIIIGDRDEQNTLIQK